MKRKGVWPPPEWWGKPRQVVTSQTPKNVQNQLVELGVHINLKGRLEGPFLL